MPPPPPHPTPPTHPLTLPGPYLSLSLRRLAPGVESQDLGDALMCVLGDALYYDAALTLGALGAQGALGQALQALHSTIFANRKSGGRPAPAPGWPAAPSYHRGPPCCAAPSALAALPQGLGLLWLAGRCILACCLPACLSFFHHPVPPPPHSWPPAQAR